MSESPSGMIRTVRLPEQGLDTGAVSAGTVGELAIVLAGNSEIGARTREGNVVAARLVVLTRRFVVTRRFLVTCFVVTLFESAAAVEVRTN